MNIFEYAVKNKVRFNYKGTIDSADLWDLDVTELDSIYKELSKIKKSMSEDSLLGAKSADSTLVNIQIELIRHVVESKLAEKEARLLRAEKKEKKEKIMAILASKQDSALEKKSEATLKKMLEEL